LTLRDEIKIPFAQGSEQQVESMIFRLGAKRQYVSRRVSSFYFDTKDLKFYRDSMEGVYPRKKIRLRTYSEPSTSLQISPVTLFNLEKKIGTSLGDQKSVETYQDAIRALSNGLSIENMYLHNVCMVSYVRSYYILGQVRLTLDRNLKFSREINSINQNSAHPESVLEIKTDNFNLASQLVAKVGLQTRRFSKYCTCVEVVGLLDKVTFGV
jgi:hypothetical protein